MPIRIGDKYERWTVVEVISKREVACRCDCGTERSVQIGNLRQGKSRSCGCLQHTVAIAPGDRFGRLTILAAPTRLAIRCRCDCGTEMTTKAIHLVAKAVLSCGCLRREVTRTRGRKNRTHGLSSHELYGTWTRMVARCTNPKSGDYSYYGGRGIRVHEPWLRVAVFIPEIVSLIGERPKGLTLDRIDVNGNYEPGNVRWATRLEQSRNQRPRRQNQQRPR
ncbi:conserved hypothetical protein [Catenulispora acidiphila DSM 44928]|uniref:HNH endonuclease n=1 Tax=Catenulispora acidiphila (strain DSM 44928 / JCM 14897 / NBRC 102108 / NRRL B-24433 / ID139908) TaxID=479433 RepID=C7Q170_CATAD|nr:hypothetical protein [Catenulispora acidiphila]ACU71745.1 conserved hypothetical protein [Catenulispora acidiphila DSM 44928]